MEEGIGEIDSADKKTEMVIDNNPDRKIDAKELKKTMKKNPWMIATAVLAVIAVVLLILILRGGITGNIITGRAIGGADAGEIFLDFAVSQGVPEDSVEIVDVNNADFHEVVYLMDGREGSFYITRDGLAFIPQAPIPFNVLNEEQEAQPPATIEYSEEDLANIKEFLNCLAEKGLKVYGAGWCGHCQDLIKYFGGEEAIAPIFIECSDMQRNPTENAKLCEEEGITGFPTIKINGELYSGARTFEAFAEVTGCSAPDI